MATLSQKKFTAVYKKSGKWYSAWIEEIPGINTQGKTLKEAKENLKDAVPVFLKAAKDLNKKFTRGKVIREPIVIGF